MRRAPGFSLIELMIAVAVIAALAAIAMPSYRDYVYRSNRAAGKTILMQVLSRQESFMSDRKAYSTTMAGLGYGSETLSVGRDGTVGAANAIYDVSFDGVPGPVYFRVKAVPKGAQVKDSCGTLTLDSAGVKTPAPATNSKCWGS